MSPSAFQELLIRSVIVAGAAAACMALCPAGWRVRVRQVVPVAAFGVLLALGAGLVLPLPGVEMQTPHFLASLTSFVGNGFAPWLIHAFVAGAALLLVRNAVAGLSVARIISKSRPAPGRPWRKLLAECQRTLGMRGSVQILLAGPGFVPSATGLLRHTVLLPDEALEWTHAQRRLVLLHELGHFSRGDLWTHALGRLACAVHWFNPFVWMLHRQLALEREFACDALVLSRGAAPEDYAMLLWKMGIAAHQPRPAAATCISMAAPGRGKLEQRVRRILEPSRRAGFWLRAADFALCAGGALLLVACASLKPVITRAFLGSGAWTPQEISARLSADPFPADK